MPTAGIHNISVNIRGSYDYTIAGAIRFAAPPAVNVGSNAVSYLPNTAYSILVSQDARPWTSAELTVKVSDSATNVLTGTPTVNGVGNTVLAVSSSGFQNFVSGEISASINAGAGTSNTRVIGYLHSGTPTITALDPVPRVALREQEFFFTPAHFCTLDSFARNTLTLTFADGSQQNCTQRSANDGCSISLPSADLPSGDVTITRIYSNSFVGSANVKIATVLTPYSVRIQYEDDVDLPAENITAIDDFLTNSFSLGPDDIVVQSLSSRKRAVFFLEVSSSTVDGTAAIAGDTTFAQPGGLLSQALSEFAPGVTGIIIDVPPPAAPPVNPPSDTTTQPPTTAGAPTDNLLPPGGLAPGAIAGIVIGCIVGVILIGLIIFFVVRRKGSGSSSSASASNKSTAAAAAPASAGVKKAAESSDEEEDSEEDEEDEEYDSEEEDEEDEESYEEESGEEESGEEESGEEESGEEESSEGEDDEDDEEESGEEEGSSEEESGEEESGEEESGEEEDEDDSGSEESS
jgi:hypothetical protein